MRDGKGGVRWAVGKPLPVAGLGLASLFGIQSNAQDCVAGPEEPQLEGWARNVRTIQVPEPRPSGWATQGLLHKFT